MAGRRVLLASQSVRGGQPACSFPAPRRPESSVIFPRPRAPTLGLAERKPRQGHGRGQLRGVGQYQLVAAEGGVKPLNLLTTLTGWRSGRKGGVLMISRCRFVGLLPRAPE